MRLHSHLSPKAIVGVSPLEGLGVFCSERIAAGELIAVWGGVIYSAAEIAVLADAFPHFRSHPFQVFDGFYMGSTSNTAIDDAERFNHGCDPNVGVSGQIVVLARRDIAVGEELLFDYETTDIAPEPFSCRCGAAVCRGTVDGSGWQSPEFRRRHQGWLSPFILRKIAG